MEVYGWLSWATSGTTRGLRNRAFDAVLLRRDGGNREVHPGGGGVAREDQERVLRAVIWAGWPDREPTWPAFPDGGGGAPRHGRGGQQLAAPGPAHRPHPLALPPEEPAAAAAPTPTQAAAQVTDTPGDNGPAPSMPGPGPQATDTGGGERTNGAGHPPGRPGPPDPERPPHPAAVRTTRGHAPPPVGETAGTTDARTGAPLTRRPLTTNR